jgi:hypothetical protein
MKIAVLYFAESTNSKVSAIAKVCSQAFASIGKSVDLVDGYRDGLRLQQYAYLCIVMESVSSTGNTVNPKIKKIFDQSTGFVGKRCCVIMPGKLLWPMRSLQNAMAMIEAQGGFIRNSALVVKDFDISGFIGRLDVEPPQR